MNILHRCMMMTVAAASAIVPAYSQSRPNAGTITVAPPLIHTSEAGTSFSSPYTAPYGEIYFSTPDRNISGRNFRTSFAIGLRYERADLGVQGMELTVEIPSTLVVVEGVGFGPAMKSPEEWTLDYHVRRTQGGSTLKIIAFGRDSAAGIVAGTYDDLFRISLAVAGAGQRGGRPAVAEIAIVEVASALAHSLGYSAGIVPAVKRSLLRLTVVPSVIGGEGEAPAVYYSPVDAVTANLRGSWWAGVREILTRRTLEMQSPRME